MVAHWSTEDQVPWLVDIEDESVYSQRGISNTFLCLPYVLRRLTLPFMPLTEGQYERIHKPNKDYIVLYSVYTLKKNKSDETSGEKNIALKFGIT